MINNIIFLRINLEPHLKFAYLLAAYGHDLNHTGHSNLFEINSKTKIALRYADESPLERNHIYKLYKAITSNKVRFLDYF